MIADLPKPCNVGTKRNSKGHTTSWIGYKLHIDAAYDSPLIKAHSLALGHVPIIDTNPRSKTKKAKLEAEVKRRKKVNYTVAEDKRYNERSTVERVNGRIKDELGANMICVRGHAKVMAYLMFEIVVLTIDQMMKFIE